jgi:hypothetical protein
MRCLPVESAHGFQKLEVILSSIPTNFVKLRVSRRNSCKVLQISLVAGASRGSGHIRHVSFQSEHDRLFGAARRKGDRVRFESARVGCVRSTRIVAPHLLSATGAFGPRLPSKDAARRPESHSEPQESTKHDRDLSQRSYFLTKNRLHF